MCVSKRHITDLTLFQDFLFKSCIFQARIFVINLKEVVLVGSWLVGIFPDVPCNLICSSMPFVFLQRKKKFCKEGEIY